MPRKKIIAKRKEKNLCINCGSPDREVEGGGYCKVCNEKNNIRSKKYRKENPDIKPIISERILRKKLSECRKNKELHKVSASCDLPSPCTACHFWSGTIAVLTELLGLPSAID